MITCVKVESVGVFGLVITTPRVSTLIVDHAATNTGHDVHLRDWHAVLRIRNGYTVNVMNAGDSRESDRSRSWKMHRLCSVARCICGPRA